MHMYFRVYVIIIVFLSSSGVIYSQGISNKKDSVKVVDGGAIRLPIMYWALPMPVAIENIYPF